MGTRWQCEHGIFIGYDDNVHCGLSNELRRSEYSRTSSRLTRPTKAIDKNLSDEGDVPTYNFFDEEIISSPSEDSASVCDCEEYGVDLNTGENLSLAE